MNNRYKQKSTNGQGFTIIEVVLVLAIAGLIFLMVFLALPALQRGQRDTQRKNDLSRIDTQLNNFQNSNRGAVPDENKLTAPGTGFVARYLDGSGDTAGSEYVDPSSGDGYVLEYHAGLTDVPADGHIFYKDKSTCGDDGDAVVSTATRQYTMRIKLEGQKSAYCIDNK
jgi:prepilin-type N-terminal cleavage/methylation domain-containing protein